MARAETVTEVTAMTTRNLVTRDYLNLRLGLLEGGLRLNQARWSVTIIASQLATSTLLIGYLSLSG